MYPIDEKQINLTAKHCLVFLYITYFNAEIYPKIERKSPIIFS